MRRQARRTSLRLCSATLIVASGLVSNSALAGPAATDAAAPATPAGETQAPAGDATASTASEGSVAASGTETAPAPTAEDHAAAHAAEREALKQELKSEILAELAAQREQAIANPEAESTEAPEPATEGANKDEKAKKDEKEANPLVPPKQDMLLGKHPVENEKSHFKPGTGLVLTSEDGRFMFAPRLRVQMRYQFDADGTGDDTEFSHIYQIRRARLQFKAHAFNKHNKMKAEFAFSPRDLSINDAGVVRRSPLLTWYAEFDYLRDFTVRMGQYKIPYSRQRVISSGDLELVDRALTQGEFNHDRDIGIDFRSKDVGGWGGRLRYYAGVYMGEGRDFGDRNGTLDFKMHYLGRVEVLPMGKFKDYKEADIERTPTPKLSLGMAYAYHDDSQGLRGVLGTTPDDEGTTDYHSMTADYMFKFKGFSSSGEFHWRNGDRNPGDAMIEDPMDPTGTIPAPVTAARNGWGFFVQGGYMIPRIPLQIGARYSNIRGLGTDDPGDLVNTGGFTSLGDKDELGGGISYYFAGHPLKLQADYFHTWEDRDFSAANDGLRIQLQLAY